MKETVYLVIMEPRDYGVAPYLMTAEALGEFLECVKDASGVYVYRFVRGHDPELLHIAHSKKGGWWLEDKFGNYVVTLYA